jgi:hypothetical protein
MSSHRRMSELVKRAVFRNVIIQAYPNFKLLLSFFVCGGGLYTAKAQENLRASPPREGGGDPPPLQHLLRGGGLAEGLQLSRA